MGNYHLLEAESTLSALPDEAKSQAEQFIRYLQSNEYR